MKYEKGIDYKLAWEVLLFSLFIKYVLDDKDKKLFEEVKMLAEKYKFNEAKELLHEK